MASEAAASNTSKITVVPADEISSLFPSQETSDEMAALYSDMFKNRYTDNDAAYVENKTRPIALPPCVTNWYTKPRRSYDWSRQGRGNPNSRNRDSGRPFYAGQRQQEDQRHERSYHPYHHGNQQDQYHQRGRGYQHHQQDRYQNYNRY